MPAIPETHACQPRAVLHADLNWMHALNQDYVVELSSMTSTEFANHIAKTSYARKIDPEAGFLLAFDQDADYAGPNYSWHKAREDKFLYVDRVVVSPDHRRKGLAKQLYRDLFRFAENEGHGRVVCEVNSDPPNPESDAFHAVLGFKVVGEAWLPDRGKMVRYLGRG